MIAKPGDSIPGGPGPIAFVDVASYTTFDSQVPITDGGLVVFGARFSPSFETGLIVGTRGNLAIAALTGMQAPGRPLGVTFTLIDLQTVWLQSGGKVLFQGVDSGTDETGFGIYSGTVGNIDLLVHSGDQANGIGQGVFYDIQGVASIALNASGTTAFSTGLSGGRRHVRQLGCSLGRFAWRDYLGRPGRNASAGGGSRGDVRG